jgi:hypothetical protein
MESQAHRLRRSGESRDRFRRQRRRRRGRWNRARPAVGASDGLAAASVNALGCFSDFSWPARMQTWMLIVVAASAAAWAFFAHCLAMNYINGIN